MTRKILIVDDESVIRDIMVDWLSEAGFETWTASNGIEGLQRLHEHQPDLVISDVWMPKMSGYHFCRMVRRVSDAAIIMMTGVPREAKVLREENLDIDDYVIKPIEMVEFMRQIEEVLKSKQGKAATDVSGASTSTGHFTSDGDHLDSREERLSEIYSMLSDEKRDLLQKMAERLLDGE